MSTGSALASRAFVLRREFDHSFAVTPPAASSTYEDFLAIGVGGDRLVMRLSDIAGVHRGATVVSMSTEVAGYLGLAAFRGILAPVYDLGAVLGHPPSSDRSWLVLARSGSPLALAFESFEAHWRLPREELPSSSDDSRSASFVRGAVRLEDIVRPIIHLPSIFEAIARQARSQGLDKER